MSEAKLDDYRNATRRSVSADFTTAIFARLNVDRHTVAATAIGEMYVAWSAEGVAAIRRADDEAAFEAWYAQRFGRRCVAAIEDDAIVRAVRAKLGGAEAAVPVDLRSCSAFEQRVLRKAAEIEAGHARSYRWLAREVGSPDAARAVGNALGNNPVPLVIPCHRVIRTDYSAGGYVFGDEAKRTLLAAEGLDLSLIHEVTGRGFRFVGCSDGTFCLPTCGDVAKRIDEPGYRGLHTEEEARACGLVPCSNCKPIAA